MHQLFAALCLMLVLEGLLLFVAPSAWQSMMRKALALRSRTLRRCGGGAIILGLLLLHLFH